ncbi:hypothetical protein [Sphingopyxis sp. NJF-3]
MAAPAMCVIVRQSSLPSLPAATGRAMGTVDDIVPVVMPEIAPMMRVIRDDAAARRRRPGKR